MADSVFVGYLAQLGTPVQGGGGEVAPSGPVPGGAGQQPPPAGSWSFPIIVFGVMILMFLMMALSGRKQKKQRDQMLASLAKNDRVQTTGGIIGTIVEVKDREVTIKSDDARFKIARSAVAHVLRSHAGGQDKPPAEVSPGR